MPAASTTNLGRLLRAAATALALALLLRGWTATPAGAEPRGPGVANANAFIDWCRANGGDPTVYGLDDYGGIIAVGCNFSDHSSLYCKFWTDGSVECSQVSPNGDSHPVNPPDGTGIAPPLTRPPSGLGTPGGNGAASGGSGGALDGGGTGSGGTMTFTGGQSGGAMMLTTPDGGGSGDGTAAPSDPTPPSGGSLPGRDHGLKPHKGHKHHGPKPGHGAPLAGKAKAATHHAKAKAKSAHHGNPGAK